jgi:hypothetical protein
MRKTVLALSALAAVAITASAVSYTEASPLVNPAGLSGAVDELAMVDNVHCRVGWRHHNPNNWRRADGCRRYYRSGGVYVVPGRTRYVIRDGVRVRVGTGSRTTVRGGDTTIRSRTNVNVRDGGGQRDGGRATQGSGQRDGGGATQGGGQRSGGATQGGGAPKGSGGAQKGGGQGQGTQN